LMVRYTDTAFATGCNPSPSGEGEKIFEHIPGPLQNCYRVRDSSTASQQISVPFQSVPVHLLTTKWDYGIEQEAWQCAKHTDDKFFPP
jgi:hypothetical protein